MKILHINSYYCGSDFYKNLYDVQVRNRLDISVFVPVSSDINDKKDFGDYTTISKNHNKYDRLFFFTKQIKIYKDLVKKYEVKKFSIIHAHSLFSNGYIALKLKRDFNIPYVVVVRSTDVNLFFKKMIHLRKIGFHILENADHVIFLSKSYRDEVIRKYVPEKYRKEILSKTEIIPNGIDDYWFDNSFSRTKEPNISNLRLLQIGDINKNKNIETTIKAVRLLIEGKYGVRLDVVGKVKDQKVFDKIKGMNFVNYLGYKSKEELIKIYRENDIFILPSLNESFGLVYAEAMSQGLPVIYSKGQGFDGQFDQGMIGYRVNPLDPKDIANKIKEVLKNHSTISNECVNRAKKFSWIEIAAKYTEIYTTNSLK